MPMFTCGLRNCDVYIHTTQLFIKKFNHATSYYVNGFRDFNAKCCQSEERNISSIYVIERNIVRK